MVRVASVQLALRQTKDLDSFLERIDHYAQTASEYGADFVLFPEHFTLQVLSGLSDKPLNASESIEALSTMTDRLRSELSRLSVAHKINIIGGSHAAFDPKSGTRRNITYVAHRDGRMDEQHKIHATPDERGVWHLTGGDRVDAIASDCGPIGVLICYDSEFPELARHLADQDIGILFVPYLTDTRQGHFRVRHCCAARTVENQHYVVTAGMVGTLENVTNLEMAYAQSAILTPCDTGFARDGIAAEAEPQMEQMIVADLDMEKLQFLRAQGSVRTLADRRHDLYHIAWKKP